LTKTAVIEVAAFGMVNASGLLLPEAPPPHCKNPLPLVGDAATLMDEPEKKLPAGQPGLLIEPVNDTAPSEQEGLAVSASGKHWAVCAVMDTAADGMENSSGCVLLDAPSLQCVNTFGE
jgi:hypothetical protein